MLGSIQDKLMRVRPPRVRITYDVETGGALEKKELPFIVGILAELNGDFLAEPLPPLKERKLVEIDRDNFNKVLEGIAPQVKVGTLPNVLPGGSGNLAGVLAFHKMDDFSPVAVIQQVAPMKALYDGRARIRFLQSKAEIAGPLAAYLDLVTDMGSDGTAARTELVGLFDATAEPKSWGKVTPAGKVADLVGPAGLVLDAESTETLMELLGQFAVDVAAPLQTAHQKGAAALIDDRVAEVDRALGLQLDVIMHSAAFQRLEATWRGLHYLVSRTETSTMLKLRVLNASKKDLLDDLTKAVEFDQSGLFKMIYEAEYGTYGGQPFSMLVGDYEFGRHPDDMTLLSKIAEVAAAGHAPFIASAYAKLFDLESFESLAKPRDLQKIFESIELTNWRAFRQSEDSRYVTLALPRVLIRLPYGPDTLPCEGVNYKEDVSAAQPPGSPPRPVDEDGVIVPAAANFLWGNAAFILAERITNAFSLYGWTAAIRGVEGGGLVEGLPVYTYKSDDGDVQMICPTQVSITDRREKELNDLGFMAICHCKGTSKAAFFGGQSANQPKKYLTDLANANAQISAMLPYILSASRFAHYIKVIMREKVGSFLTRGNVEAFLNTWIAQYVLLDENAAQEVKAAYPLSAAKISVTEVPGKPGSYKATLFLRPHFQLEELTTSIRLVAELPA
ncbi:type VI secretion system contractile sheath large subunit [Chitinimonas koreensis]|uniref:type VI secretion system contractile sheath large subunit n=1 Tax=Chitinimonas koreensis TaxID=356302 RepID=UPI0004274864|nr:type VI secretion system contractile sheath large subunit [Chitinimonas koreensis]QNM95350.1 type VI secretion system contractile sheath large subunit [Chitinimonas koreensis]